MRTENLFLTVILATLILGQCYHNYRTKIKVQGETKVFGDKKRNAVSCVLLKILQTLFVGTGLFDQN